MIYESHSSLYVLQYPNSNAASVSYGILRVFMDYNINHTCSTMAGSSGSPILNLKIKQ